MTILGVDWGRARVGVAVSDELDMLAHPMKTVPVTSLDKLAAELTALARERGASEIVLGLPLNMDGSEGDSARSVRLLSDRLRQASGLPVTLCDERLTSWEADKRLSESPRGRRPGRQDQAAAALILQSYLDARKRKPA